MDGSLTHNPPSIKTAVRMYFCIFGNRRVLSTGIGKMQIMKSVTILNEAFVNQTTCKSRQWPPGIFLSQKNAIGVQAKMLPRKVHNPYAATMLSTAQAMRLIVVLTNNCRNWSNMETLTSVRPAL